LEDALHAADATVLATEAAANRGLFVEQVCERKDELRGLILPNVVPGAPPWLP
jgi:hypothetical protein